MDNLELMQQIQDNSLDLIYCDILYGTGRNFGDYQDIKAEKSIIFDFYTDRIKEMHRILQENGVIVLQCDYRINHWIRNILDDVFGYDNFIVLQGVEKHYSISGVIKARYLDHRRWWEGMMGVY